MCQRHAVTRLQTGRRPHRVTSPRREHTTGYTTPARRARSTPGCAKIKISVVNFCVYKNKGLHASEIKVKIGA